MENVAHRRRVWHSSVAVGLLLAGCGGTVAPSTVPPSVESGLAGTITIDGGPHEGTYAVEATPAETVCQRSGERWVIGFAKQQLVAGVTTLQAMGSGEGDDARLDDLFLTVGETTEDNTVRLTPEAAVSFTPTGDQAQATIKGTASDGIEAAVSVACAPLGG
jgi:hypothetical protein